MQMQHVNEEGRALPWEDSHIIYTSAVGLAGSFIRSDTEQLKKTVHMFVLFCLFWYHQVGKL